MLPALIRSARQRSQAQPMFSLARAVGDSSRGFAAEAAAPVDTTAAADAPASTPEPGYSGPPKLVVFGGRGFVGSAVCKEALKTGLHVVSISPSGTPPTSREPWSREVEWLRGNALEPATYAHALQGALGAISCVGGFGSQADMLRVNGAANAAAIAAASSAGVPRFVYVSAHIPNIPGFDVLLSGYVQGKKQAEEELFRCYPDAGVALRPWVIYGDRTVTSSLTLPLGVVFGPVEALLKRLPNAKQLAALPVVGAGFVPPVAVEQVAKAAVAAATDPTVPGGVVDDWQIADWK